MSTNEDLRIIKTKMAIKSAFFQLMSEKSFEKITVSDITERALIHRGTFYAHYKDKYDLKEKIEDETMENMDRFLNLVNKDMFNDIIENHEPLPHIIPLLTYIEENPEIFKLIAENNTSFSFYEKIADRYFGLVMKTFQCTEDKWMKYRKDIALAIITSILSRWVSDGMQEPKEELAIWITELMLSNWNVLLASLK